MSVAVWSMLLIIGSQLAYHLAQKTVAPSANPFAVFTLVYAVATLVCLFTAPVLGRSPSLGDFRQVLTWPVALLALSVVGIEIGYLVAYRNGWSLGITFAVASTTTVVLLAIVGTLFFTESLGARQLLGLSLVLGGSWMLVSTS